MMAALVVGDPMEPGTQVGPLATPQIVADLEDQIGRAVAAGTRVVTGGHRLNRPGTYFAPTVLTGVPTSSPVYREEMFGPAAMVFRAQGIDEALAIANDTPFGLGASAWTNDSRERERFIDELESGLVFINGMVASDTRLPFGGIKRSGYGRELGPHGIMEFVNVKTVWIA
jgi:succinate-semialdehyde dehydrogenase/glutarate-semialdehyde dehydrogenase